MKRKELSSLLLVTLLSTHAYSFNAREFFNEEDKKNYSELTYYSKLAIDSAIFALSASLVNWSTAQRELLLLTSQDLPPQVKMKISGLNQLEDSAHLISQLDHLDPKSPAVANTFSKVLASADLTMLADLKRIAEENKDILSSDPKTMAKKASLIEKINLVSSQIEETFITQKSAKATEDKNQIKKERAYLLEKKDRMTQNLKGLEVSQAKLSDKAVKLEKRISTLSKHIEILQDAISQSKNGAHKRKLIAEKKALLFKREYMSKNLAKLDPHYIYWKQVKAEAQKIVYDELKNRSQAVQESIQSLSHESSSSTSTVQTQAELTKLSKIYRYSVIATIISVAELFNTVIVNSHSPQEIDLIPGSSSLENFEYVIERVYDLSKSIEVDQKDIQNQLPSDLDFYNKNIPFL